MTAVGTFAGVTLMERVVAALAELATAPDGSQPFRNRRVELVATAGAESHLRVGAWNDNVDALRNVVSRDCGLMQVNIPARLIGTQAEAHLRTESHDPEVARQVALQCLHAAAALYMEPWVFPGGDHEPRQWQAWVAYKGGWPLYPHAWVWSHVTANTWVATGRYLFKAIRGVANNDWLAGRRSLAGALAEAEALAHTYGVNEGELLSSPTWGVYWRYPPKPTVPGTAADYPVPNDGRSYLGPPRR